MCDIGAELREVEFEPLPEEPVREPEPVVVVDEPVPAPA
ncbi:MAG: hypothetical protein JWN87_1680 [Frankiales bacterium]|jgi:hypothetical protein|nr:hypothetical protein [Frankiales bacterium]MCW2585163.1 hypothetical protein [Frankiales bacterium]